MPGSLDFKQQIRTELLAGLNPVQNRAVQHTDGPLLIVAGAGSGKTRVITHRIAWLCRIHDVAPWNIAAVTFTNKAAAEMRERLLRLIGPMAERVTVRTFHSLALYILTRNVDQTGLKSGFSVYDQSAQQSLLKKILKDFKLSGEQFSPRHIANRINMARDRLVGSEVYEEHFHDFYNKEIGRVYREYIKRLRSLNALDFGDLLYESVYLLQNNMDVRQRYQQLWKWFMIDEYQDTNHVQYHMGRLIAREHHNIMVVGDDDQSIYSWRGADITNILNFESDYQSALVLKLEENYRSTANILKAASSVIAHNSERRAKTLFTSQERGEPIQILEHMDENEEARAVAELIRRLRQDNEKLAEIAIFYRTNAQSRVFETALREASLPYMIVGDIRFYERREIKDMLAYLAVVVNPLDEEALERIINVPARGIGAGTLDKLRQLAFEKRISLFAALAQAGDLPRLRSLDKIQHLYQRLIDWRSAHLSAEWRPSVLVKQVMVESGYLGMLESDPTPEAPGRIENLYALLASIEEYEKEFGANLAVDSDNRAGGEEESVPNAGPNLTDFMQRISLFTTREGETSPEQADTDREHVYLMTLHNAKGLEFRHVFLCGLEEGLLPHMMSLQDGSIDEERRLLYVGITRARRNLTLSVCQRRRVMGTYQNQMPSRFLKEIDESVLVRSCRDASGAYGALRHPPAAASFRKPAANDMAAVYDFQVGERVRHARYGAGRITAIENTVSGPKLFIQFDDESSKVFLARYAPLQRL
ncbi:MAG: UvrD-helicase domain-containing protein [Leptospiraceae bacterium]|nr:UvrD-helicase domain-containing protein [Leptospiraceae bacterium]